MVWVEGTREDDPTAVTWTLCAPAGQLLASDAVKFSVEPIVWPDANAVTEDLKNTRTDQWPGLALGAAWYISSSLEGIIDGFRGRIETIHPDTTQDGKPAASSDGPDATTTKSYPNGFVMEIDYFFETSRNGPWGYIQAFGKPKKLSFVGNSGIKFGGSLTHVSPKRRSLMSHRWLAWPAG
jgi:hypothetical protein